MAEKARQMEAEEAAMWSELRGEGERWTYVKAAAAGTEAAEAEALALAGVWAWARARGEGMPPLPSGFADPSTIQRILTSLDQSGVADSLWHHSPESRDEYSLLTHFIAPIAHLPTELLHEIFFIIIYEAGGPPLTLMLVCKYWHAIVTGMWASLNLGTYTPMDAVARKLERNPWLDIVVHTDSDRGHFTPSDGAFEAIFATIEASSRWRSFVVNSFPAQADLPEDLVNRRLQRYSTAPMSRFTTFKINAACETSPLLHGLLRILGTGAGPELTRVEINSANVISFLASVYPSMFHSVKILSLNTPGIPNPVDLLPHLHQLETFTASYLSIPTYHDHIELPFVYTLRHLRLRAASIQWMSGRTFHVLEDCTFIFPHHRHVLPTFSTILPNCNHLTFQGYPLDILGGVSAHKLRHLSVTCPGSVNGRGNQQLVWLSCQVLGENRLAPKILHISIRATDQAWMKVLGFMSYLEELVIHTAQPSALGAKPLQSLVARPVLASNFTPTSTPGELGAPLCPSLKRFGLKYDRWLRSGEQFDLIPVCVSIFKSRQRSNYSLESFNIWMTKNQEDPLELVKNFELSPTGLSRLESESRRKEKEALFIPSSPDEASIKRPRVSRKQLRWAALIDDSGIGGEKSPITPHSDQGLQKRDSSPASQAEGPRGGQVEVREFPRDFDTGARAQKIRRPSTWS